MLKSIFTWWNSATIGIRFTVARRAVFIGQDDYGNRYYEARDNRDSYDDRKRRWVIYNGYADASKVPAEWHGWLHYTIDAPLPETGKHPWQKPHLPNATGTPSGYRPTGHDYRGGHRATADGDYESWTPGS